MDRLIRISVVSYLNSRPYMHGLTMLGQNNPIFDISSDIPARCAEKLQNDEADIGLIPVAMIPQLGEAHILTDFCISADGKVDSVLLVSQTPLEGIREIFLDKESRTSVQLARILAREWWKIDPVWIEESVSAINPVSTNAAVIIGDRALQMASEFTYVYDLAEEWKKMTGLPFVFAAWVSNKVIDAKIIDMLSETFESSLPPSNEQINEWQALHPFTDVNQYLNHRIKYQLGEREKQGLKLFLKKTEIANGSSKSEGAIHI